MRRVGHDQRREHLACRGIVLPPAFADERDGCFCTRDIGRIAALVPSLGEAARRDEARHALRMPNRVRDRDRRSLRDTEEREAVESALVNHRFEVLNERLEGKRWDVTIGETDAALVIPHQRALRGEAAE